MRKVLLLGGNLGSIKKVNKMELNFTNHDDFKIISLLDLETSLNIYEAECARKLTLLLQSADTEYRAKLFFISDIARLSHLNYTFRIKIKQILSFHVTPKTIMGLKVSILNFFSLRKLVYLGSYFFGLFRLPKQLLSIILKLGFNDHIIFKEIIESLEVDLILIFTANYDNLSFLIKLLNKDLKQKSLMVILNWDNTSSKAVISPSINKVALWNFNQIEEVIKFSKISKSKLTTIGSKVSDAAHLKYKSNHSKCNNDSKLLFLGQQNRCDELNELLAIKEFLDLRESPYDQLVYRPNPNGKLSYELIESGKLDESGIEICRDEDIDLRMFKGIISLPTTMLLEVVLSGVPAVIYTPKHQNYLMNPYNNWNYYHFNYLKKLSPISVVKNMLDLKIMIKQGLPSQKKYSKFDFNKIFPEFNTDYETRLLQLITKVLNE